MSFLQKVIHLSCGTKTASCLRFWRARLRHCASWSDGSRTTRTSWWLVRDSAFFAALTLQRFSTLPLTWASRVCRQTEGTRQTIRHSNGTLQTSQPTSLNGGGGLSEGECLRAYANTVLRRGVFLIVAIANDHTIPMAVASNRAVATVPYAIFMLIERPDLCVPAFCFTLFHWPSRFSEVRDCMICRVTYTIRATFLSIQRIHVESCRHRNRSRLKTGRF